ncbi:MAG TPA: secondary thiamine-phosphate synthase enzyme YjbQ [Candidatus Acidoferrales bacterium]|nr:secondary thiamine-phosphate synthase enzyme YjbQ [Candidatus Acidoferrales bacterium]
MKIYNEQFALQSQKQREVFNITTQVKAASEKSGLREGIMVVSSLHSNTAIIVTQDEPRLLADLFDWLTEVSPTNENYRHEARFEGAANVHFQSLLLSHQAIVPFTEGRLDLGPEQAVLFVEFDGLRPRRIVVKIVGE